MQTRRNQTNTMTNQDHWHTCVKCARLYTHAHVGGDEHHKQFAFQCPYLDCEWARNKLPDGMTRTTQAELGENGLWARHLPGEPGGPKLTLGAADFYKRTLRKMKTGDEAKTVEQMDACRWAWEQNWSDSYASDVVFPGSFTKGVKGCGSRKVFQTHFALTPAQLSSLQEDYPSLWFITGTEYHDHPLSHITTQIASRSLVNKVTQDLREEGTRALDLHGNPRANFFTNKKTRGKIDTVVEKVMPKDYVRASTKWGDLEAAQASGGEVFTSTLRDLSHTASADMKTKLGRYSTLLSMHTLYYYERREIAAILANAKDGAILHAIVHKHDGEYGMLSHGEMSWDRDERGFITQENVLTGECYSHPNIDWLFHGASSWHDGTHGMGWTLKKIAHEQYLASFVSVPVPQCRMDPKAAASVVTPPPKTHSMTISGTVMELEGVDRQTVSVMASHVSGKSRTPAQFKDHLAATKRAMKKAGTLTTHNPASTALASFFRDIEKEAAAVGLGMTSSHDARRAFKVGLEGYVPLDTMNLIDKVLFISQQVATIRGDKHQAAMLGLGREVVKPVVL